MLGVLQAGQCGISVVLPTVWTQQDRLQASNAGAGDQFGYSTAINSSGDTVIGSAPFEDTTASDAGSLYAFLRTSGWAQQQQIQASDAAASDNFGGSTYAGASAGYRFVAISDDGNRAAVGMSNDGGLTGAVYVFLRTSGTWAEEQKLTASDASAGDGFGYSVAFSAAGDYLAIGAPRDSNSNGSQAGSVYIFTRSGTTWSQQARVQLTSGSSSIDEFGGSVALNSDATTMVGGMKAVGKSTVFTRSGTTWTQQQVLTASDASANNEFGYSVALDTAGDTLVVGASAQTTSVGTLRGAAYVFTRSAGTWTQQVKLIDAAGTSGDKFGCSVAIDGSAATIVVGAYLSDADGTNSGAAFVFTTYGAWTLYTQLSGTDTETADLFGFCVAISRAGTYAAIGAPGDTNSGGASAGSVYVFTLI